MILPTSSLEHIVLWYCNQGTKSTVAPSDVARVSGVARETIEELPFSKTGRLSSDVLATSRTLNPSYALFNCVVKATETAALLETGTMPDLKLTFPNSPRPLYLRQAIKKFPMVYRGDCEHDRIVYVLKSISKAQLNSIMHVAGKCHAVVLGTFKRFPVGHAWNYVKETTEAGEDHFVILDSYSQHHHDKGITDPEGYLASYADKLEALLFFDEEHSSKVDSGLDRFR